VFKVLCFSSAPPATPKAPGLQFGEVLIAGFPAVFGRLSDFVGTAGED
jgi:hypothetical protein